MISHEMTRTMETALAEWVRAQAVPLVLAADTEDEAAAVIELLAWAPEQPLNAAPLQGLPVTCAIKVHGGRISSLLVFGAS